jgi:WD40 repeat protein
VAAFEGHAGQIWGLAFSKDNDLLISSSFDGSIRLWDLTNSEHVSILEGHKAQLSTVSVSNDGRLFASGSWDGLIGVWGVWP